SGQVVGRVLGAGCFFAGAALGGFLGGAGLGFGGVEGRRLFGGGGGAAEVGGLPPDALGDLRVVALGAVDQVGEAGAEGGGVLVDVLAALGVHGLADQDGDRDVALEDAALPALGPEPLGAPERDGDHRHLGGLGHADRAALDVLDGERPADGGLGEHADHFARLQHAQRGRVRAGAGAAV